MHVLVLLKGFFFPYPELFVYPYLTNIGLMPYVQILDQHFPGLMFFPINLANIGFVTPDHFRVLQIGTIIALHILIYKIGFSLTDSKKTALLGNILYFIIHPFLEGNVVWIDNFIPLLLLPAFYFLAEKKRIFWAGLLLGLAILLKQVVIPTSILIFLWLWFTDKKLTRSFFLGIAIPVTILVFYIFSKGLLNDFIYWTYTFNISTFAQMGRKYPTFRQLLAMGVLYFPAILVSLYGFISRKRELSLLSLMLFGSLLFAYARFDYVHLQPSLPFAILAIVYFFGRISEKVSKNLFILYLLPLVWLTTRFYMTSIGDKVNFFGSTEYNVADKIIELTDPGDPIFMYGTLPHMYQMTSTRPSGNIFVFHFPWFMKIAEDKVLNGLQSDPPRVVVQQKSASIDDYYLYDYMQKIEKYVSENYEKIEEVEGVEILVPKR